MKITPEELVQNNYVLVDKLDHNELIPFVKKYIKQKTIFSATYYLSILISFSFLIFFFTGIFKTGNFTMKEGLQHCTWGILMAVALVPFHELIHAFAYKFVGAKETSYDMNLKKFYFLAMADKFVADKKEFQFVALAPFTIISLALIIVSFYTTTLWTITMLSCLTLHAMMCSGDFALLSYFEFRKGKKIVTYDDKENKVSFFYEKISS